MARNLVWAGAVSVAILLPGVQPAHASTWACDGVSFCTNPVSAGASLYYGGPYAVACDSDGPQEPCLSLYPTQVFGVVCYEHSININGDDVWYKGVLLSPIYPEPNDVWGWVAGYDLQTGADPVPGTPQC